MNEIELAYVSIKYEAPIVYFDYKEGAQLGFPEIRELIYYAEKLSGHKPYLTFSDVRVDMNITEEGKRIVENLDNMPLFRGTAVLVRNGASKFVANFINTFSRKKYPFRAFADKKKAVEWLLGLDLEAK